MTSKAILAAEKQHPKLKLLTILVKAGEFLGNQTFQVNKKTGDVTYRVVMKKFITPVKSRGGGTGRHRSLKTSRRKA